MQDTTRTSPGFTPLREKLPSMSVTVPVEVPLIWMEAPITDCPLASRTTPEHALFCCAEIEFSAAWISEMVTPPKNAAMHSRMPSVFVLFNITVVLS